MNAVALARTAAIALLFGAAAFGASTSAGPAQPASTLRLGVYANENSAEAYYAKDMGFFAKAGIDVEFQTMQGDPVTIAAIVSNVIDIGYISIAAAAAVHQKDIPVKLVAPASEYLSPATTGIGALVLPADSPVRLAKDLDGKIIAESTLHSIGETVARAWIDQNGGDSATVKFVEVPLPSTPVALDTHRIDGAWISEPFLSIAKKNGRVLVYGYDSIAKHFLVGGWFTTVQWPKDHPDLVARFGAVMHETAVWANKNPEKSGEILAKYTKLDPALIANMARSHYAEQLTPGLMQPLIDAHAKYNGFRPFPAQDLLP